MNKSIPSLQINIADISFKKNVSMKTPILFEAKNLRKS